MMSDYPNFSRELYQVYVPYFLVFVKKYHVDKCHISADG